MAEKPGTVGADQLATFFGITRTWVYRLVKEGMPAIGRGRFDLLECAAWYIRHLRKANEARTRPGEVGGADHLRKERASALQIETELKRMDLALRRGELIAVGDAAELWERAIERYRGKMIASIGVGARRCIGLRTIAEANGILEEIIHEALRELVSAGRESKNGDGSNGGGGAKGGEAPPVARVRAGRPAPETQGQ